MLRLAIARRRRLKLPPKILDPNSYQPNRTAIQTNESNHHRYKNWLVASAVAGIAILFASCGATDPVDAAGKVVSKHPAVMAGKAVKKGVEGGKKETVPLHKEDE